MTQTLDRLSTAVHDNEATASPSLTEDQILQEVYLSNDLSGEILTDIDQIEDPRARISALAEVKERIGDTFTPEEIARQNELICISALELTANVLEDGVHPGLPDAYCMTAAYDAIEAYNLTENYRRIAAIDANDIKHIDHLPQDLDEQKKLVAGALKAVIKDAANHEDDIHQRLEDAGNLPLHTATGRAVENENICGDLAHALIQAANQHSPIKQELYALRQEAHAETDALTRAATHDRIDVAKRSLHQAQARLDDIRAIAREQSYSADDATPELIESYAAVLEAEHELKTAEDLLNSIPYPINTQEVA